MRPLGEPTVPAHLAPLGAGRGPMAWDAAGARLRSGAQAGTPEAVKGQSGAPVAVALMSYKEQSLVRNSFNFSAPSSS